MFGFTLGWTTCSLVMFHQHCAEKPSEGGTTLLPLSSLQGAKQSNDDTPWSSLSSPYALEATTQVNLEDRMRALEEWRSSMIDKLSMPMFCYSPNETVTKSCEANNAKVATKLKSQGGLTRKTLGYNFFNWQIVLAGKDACQTTIGRLSRAWEMIFQYGQLHSAVNFLGVSSQQNPLDAFAISDLIWRVQPDLFIELGTSGGGSAALWALVMQRYNPQAKILTIDPAAGKWNSVPLKQWNDAQVKLHCPHCIHAPSSVEWSRNMIRFYRGMPDSPQALEIARQAAAKAKTVVVMDDSNHLQETVKANLQAYHSFVTPGSYFIVQDTRLQEAGQNPHLAIKEFLLKTRGGRCFDIDKRWEYFVFSQHFDGFLRRRPGCTVKS